MRLGLDSKENGRSPDVLTGNAQAPLASREVSESTAESAVDVAESSKRSVTRRGAPSLPVCVCVCV